MQQMIMYSNKSVANQLACKFLKLQPPTLCICPVFMNLLSRKIGYLCVEQVLNAVVFWFVCFCGWGLLRTTLK